MEKTSPPMEQPLGENAQVMEVNIEKTAENVGQNEEKRGADFEQSGSIGKFKNTESLLDAYNNLQAEFTRKCQKLSQFEKSAQEAPSSQQSVENYIQNNQEMVNQIIKHYLEEVSLTKVPASISNAGGSGIPLTAPPNPTTLEEAREVMKNLFK